MDRKQAQAEADKRAARAREQARQQAERDRWAAAVKRDQARKAGKK